MGNIEGVVEVSCWVTFGEDLGALWETQERSSPEETVKEPKLDGENHAGAVVLGVAWVSNPFVCVLAAIGAELRVRVLEGNHEVLARVLADVVVMREVRQRRTGMCRLPSPSSYKDSIIRRSCPRLESCGEDRQGVVMLREAQVRAVVQVRVGQGGGCGKESVFGVRGTERLNNLLYLMVDEVLEE
jgi:hypothetical protein